MLKDKYVFPSLVSFLDRDKFNNIVRKRLGDKYIKSFSCWNQLLVMMFGQLTNRESLRDLIIATEAHSSKLYHLGMGKSVTRSNLAKANETRDWRIFEEFAFYMIEQARVKRRSDIFSLGGSVYAFDSTTIDLCLSVFDWAKFRKHKGGIKMHTLYDIETQVPAFVHITTASTHDSKAMPEIPYESGAHYVFDRGYNDYANLYKIQLINVFFVVRAKSNVKFKPIRWKRRLKGGITSDSIGTFTIYKSAKDYPKELRKIIYIDSEDKKRYIFLTNDLDAPAELICELYRNRWSVELFFKWIKQHLRIRKFWGTSENERLLRAIICDNNIDIILNQWCLPFYTTILCSKARKGTYCKLISVLHGIPDNSKKIIVQKDALANATNVFLKCICRLKLKLTNAIIQRSERYVYCHSDRYVLLSDSFKQIFCQYAGIRENGKLLSISNPLTIKSEFDTDILSHKKKHILYVGRMDKENKRVNRIIEAWEEIYDDYVDWQLVLVGDGPHKQLLEDYVKQKNIQRCLFTVL